MIDLHYNRFKYGRELLLDCVSFHELITSGVKQEEAHTTLFYEAFFIFKGSGRLRIEGEERAFTAGSVFLFDPGVPRQWFFGEGMETMVVLFEESFIRSFFKDELFLLRLSCFGSNRHKQYVALTESECKKYHTLCGDIKHEINNTQPDKEHLLRAYLYQMLILLNRNYAEQHQVDVALFDNSEAIQFKKLIAENIQHKQTVNEYAALMGIDRGKLNRLSKDVFAREATTLIKDALLDACKSALLLTDDSVSEIAYRFNFSAPSNFMRFFKTQSGFSPSEYREHYSKR